jgi:hypothetical protein
MDDGCRIGGAMTRYENVTAIAGSAVIEHRAGRPSIATPWAAMIEGWLAKEGGAAER